MNEYMVFYIKRESVDSNNFNVTYERHSPVGMEYNLLA